MTRESLMHGRPALASILPRAGGVLRRKCACGGKTSEGDICDECRDKKLQRKASTERDIQEAPPIVYDVLRSPGRPLDKKARTFFETRFGHDFSRVRIHTGEKAERSASMVDAAAYTVGQDIVFGSAQYAPGSSIGMNLLAHELTHTIQQSGVASTAAYPLRVDSSSSQDEQIAEATASRITLTTTVAPTIASNSGTENLQRAALHSGRMLDEGDCAHLACNSKWACKDNANGVKCPDGTRNASATEKYRPLFTCDTKCEKNLTCDDSGTWMAIPNSLFKRSKCDQDLVICANGRFVHGQVRDRSEREAWEVSHGIQDALGISPYASFQGSIYPSESDAAFKSDITCFPKEKANPDKDKKRDLSPSGPDLEMLASNDALGEAAP